MNMVTESRLDMWLQHLGPFQQTAFEEELRAAALHSLKPFELFLMMASYRQINDGTHMSTGELITILVFLLIVLMVCSVFIWLLYDYLEKSVGKIPAFMIIAALVTVFILVNHAPDTTAILLALIWLSLIVGAQELRAAS